LLGCAQWIFNEFSINLCYIFCVGNRMLFCLASFTDVFLCFLFLFPYSIRFFPFIIWCCCCCWTPVAAVIAFCKVNMPSAAVTHCHPQITHTHTHIYKLRDTHSCRLCKYLLCVDEADEQDADANVVVATFEAMCPLMKPLGIKGKTLWVAMGDSSTWHVYFTKCNNSSNRSPTATATSDDERKEANRVREEE